MKVRLSAKMQAFATLRAGEESLRYSLYHFLQPAAGALPTMTYFQNPVAGQDQFGAAVTQEDSNMDVGGQLSAPNRFLIDRICVPVEPATTEATPVSDAALTATIPDDIYQVVKRGYFEFTLLSKPYLRLAPLGLLPAGFGLWAALAGATTVAATSITNAVASNGFPSDALGYKAVLPLETQTTFRAVISFPKATLTTANALRIGVVLHGTLFRPEQ